MPFPRSERVVYAKSPLTEVNAELRFPTILRIETEPPAGFQERIRQEYPRYERETAQDFLIPKDLLDALQRFGAPVPLVPLTHKFLTDNRQRNISIGTRPQSNQCFLALTERKYQRWEIFRGQLLDAEEKAKEEYAPSYYERVGLRYQDIIDPTLLGLQGHSWADLLTLSAAGLLADPNVDRVVAKLNSVVLLHLDEEVPGGFMQVRYGLAPVSAKIGGSARFVIDIDCYKEGKITREEAIEALDRFHEVASSWFRASLTDLTKAALEPRKL